MRNCNRIILLAFALSITLISTAQSSPSATSNNEGFMRSEAKIYVVMVVVITILAGLLLYLVRLDRKITRLEKGNL